jgi:predicted HTH transcriptional regulator
MLRDASVKTQDMLVLEEMDLTVFNEKSINGYRMRMHLSRPNHVWETLDNEEFLLRIGAIGIGKDGKKHPTSAGLLMFGNEYCITREFNNYFLDYQERYDAELRWTDRIVSSSGDWSGNVYDFYFRVYNKLAQDIKVPFAIKNGIRVDDTPVHQALREALANCLVNADYYGRQGIVVIKKKEEITFSNPGGFRIEIDAAKSGGVSDPRNGAMLKMFNLINIGERAGSGIPNIMSIWGQKNWIEPMIVQSLEPERTTLTLSLKEAKGKNVGDKKSAIKIGDKKSAITEAAKQIIIEYLTECVSASCSEIASVLNLQLSRTRDYLVTLIAEGVIIAEGANRNRTYRLKR